MSTLKSIAAASAAVFIAGTSQGLADEGPVKVIDICDMYMIKVMQPKTMGPEARIVPAAKERFLVLPEFCLVNEGGELAAASAGLSGVQQHNTMSGETSRAAQARLTGGANEFTSRSMFVSSQNLGQSPLDRPDLNLWMSAEARKFNGDLDGNSYDLVLGADTLIGTNSLVGGFISFDRLELESDGLESTVKSPAVGGYFAHMYDSGLIVDAYLAYAKPKVSADGGSARGKRVSGSISVTGMLDRPNAIIRPFFQLGGYDQELPAYFNNSGPVAAEDTYSVNTSIGARFESKNGLSGGALKPHATVALEYRKIGSDQFGDDDFTHPRLGFGLAGELGAGYLSIDVDGGKSTSGTYDVGLQAMWEFKF